MARKAGSSNLTPEEDLLALLLSESGFSHRRIAAVLERATGCVGPAIERAKATGHRLTAAQGRALKKLQGLKSWLAEGERKGYLAHLVALAGE
jgi:hypothetical protein